MFCRYSMLTNNPFRRLDSILLDQLRNVNPKARPILYVLDLPIQQALAFGGSVLVDKESYEIEAKIFAAFDVFCVVNNNMARAISRRYGISLSKFVEFRIHDYGVAPIHVPIDKPKPKKWRLICAGNGNKTYAGEWAKELLYSPSVTYEFVGYGWEWLRQVNRQDIIYKGQFSQQQLSDYSASSSHFGIIAYSDELAEYLEYCCPSKFGAYLSAGVPVIVLSKNKYLTSLVRKYAVGFALDHLEEIPTVLEALSESEYNEMRRASLDLGNRIREGFFFKRAVIQSINKLR